MNGKDQKNNFSYNLISWHKKNGRHNLPWQFKINPYKRYSGAKGRTWRVHFGGDHQ